MGNKITYEAKAGLAEALALAMPPRDFLTYGTNKDIRVEPSTSYTTPKP